MVLLPSFTVHTQGGAHQLLGACVCGGRRAGKVVKVWIRSVFLSLLGLHGMCEVCMFITGTCMCRYMNVWAVGQGVSSPNVMPTGPQIWRECVCGGRSDKGR